MGLRGRNASDEVPNRERAYVIPFIKKFCNEDTCPIWNECHGTYAGDCKFFDMYVFHQILEEKGEGNENEDRGI